MTVKQTCARFVPLSTLYGVSVLDRWLWLAESYCHTLARYSCTERGLLYPRDIHEHRWNDECVYPPIIVNEWEHAHLLSKEASFPLSSGVCRRYQRCPRVRNEHDCLLLGLVRGRGPVDPPPRSDGRRRPGGSRTGERAPSPMPTDLPIAATAPLPHPPPAHVPA
ncbi:hypothetical protein BC628DRAFT_622731 [Trametes gibbosa]|nr:hypothetical protein BC628DRAFT_622731 [Trametes gibbosa]